MCILYIWVCVCVCYVHIFAFMYVCTCVCGHVHFHAFMYVSMFCMYICAYVCLCHMSFMCGFNYVLYCMYSFLHFLPRFCRFHICSVCMCDDFTLSPRKSCSFVLVSRVGLLLFGFCATFKRSCTSQSAKLGYHVADVPILTMRFFFAQFRSILRNFVFFMCQTYPPCIRTMNTSPPVLFMVFPSIVFLQKGHKTVFFNLWMQAFS